MDSNSGGFWATSAPARKKRGRKSDDALDKWQYRGLFLRLVRTFAHEVDYVRKALLLCELVDICHELLRGNSGERVADPVELDVDESAKIVSRRACGICLE